MTTVAQPTPAQQDSNTRYYLDLMIDGMKPPERPDVGRWLPLVEMAEQAYESSSNGNRGKLVAELLNSCIRTEKFPGLEAMLTGNAEVPSGVNLPQTSEVEPENEIMPALPESARLPEGQSKEASLLRDIYIDYSKAVSPEGAEGFHEGGFLSLLSTINARRTKIPFRDKDYCSLMIAFVAESTDYAKTTTAKVVEKVLEAAGLSWFIGAGKITPQRLVQEMCGVIPKDYLDLDPAVQERIKMRLAFAGQRGWHAGEMGKMIKSMMNGNSAMADFQSLLLEMDDNKDRYENATISRSTEIIEKPYLSILGCMTPQNLQSNAKTGAEFWNDGTWARWAFYCPPDGSGLDNPMELGDLPPPAELVFALRKWHFRLGVPYPTIEAIRDEKGAPTGKFTYTKEETIEEVAVFGEGVWDAWARYRSGLKHLAKKDIPKDLKSSYGRLAVKAMRIATLIASLENNGQIEMRHWALAQEITERMRRSLHELYTQINAAPLNEPSYARKIENEVVRVVKKLEDQDKPPTLRDISRYLPKIDRGRLKMALLDLCRAEILQEDKTSHAVKYRMNTNEDA